MLTQERSKGVLHWKRGVLVIYSMDKFTNELLPKYFNTRNFKTFRRQLNYYGFVHVRSHAVSGTRPTALWANPQLMNSESDSISNVLSLRRIEANDASKTPEGRRDRKNELACSIELEGLGVSLSEVNSTHKPRASSQLFPPSILASVACEVPPSRECNHDGYDSRIDEAAGLLVSILHAHS